MILSGIFLAVGILAVLVNGALLTSAGKLSQQEPPMQMNAVNNAPTGNVIYYQSTASYQVYQVPPPSTGHYYPHPAGMQQQEFVYPVPPPPYQPTNTQINETNAQLPTSPPA